MNEFLEFCKNNIRIIIGAVCGLLAGILLLTLGFFGTLLIAFCIFIGVIIAADGPVRRMVLGLFNKLLDKFKSNK